MEIGDKLKDLDMTVDEMDRLTKAFKDEKFREMLRDYAQELSEPANRKKYEEEIKILEQERGNTIEFIHPQPFRTLRTSVNGEQKCFINICGNDKVEKPASRWGLSEEGRRGQCWSLPHSLHPGRQDTDPKGKRIMIYDVIFHPDTLHIASKNKSFMDMVTSTAIQGIQNAFKVTLDKNNVREMRTKYKGTPQPCVIRRPIPGYKPTASSEKPDPLAFPYPDEKRPAASSQTEPTESRVTKNSSYVEPNSFQIKPPKTNEPTKPKYTVKYRSFIDLQDFRCSRDSAQGPRPKEIVITIDMPLLKAATDASLEVKERHLLLESKKPAYRLELLLAYPVDEDKGEAKFNKQRGQLTVTLPVLPSNEGFDFIAGAAEDCVSDDERQEEKSELEEEEWKEGKMENEEVVKDSEERDLKQQTGVEKSETKRERGQGLGEEQMNEEEIGEEEKEVKWKKDVQKCQDSLEEEKVKEQKQENDEEGGKLKPQQRQQDGDKWMSKYGKLREDECDREKKDSAVTGFHSNAVTEEKDSHMASPESETVLSSAEYSRVKAKEGEVETDSYWRTADIKEDTEKTKDGSSEAVPFNPPESRSQNNKTDCCISQKAVEPSEMPATDEANTSSSGGSGNSLTLCSEQLAGSLKCEEWENIDGDELPPPVLLREIDEDGNEKVISDHSTSAGFTFQNSLIFELD